MELRKRKKVNYSESKGRICGLKTVVVQPDSPPHNFNKDVKPKGLPQKIVRYTPMINKRKVSKRISKPTSKKVPHVMGNYDNSCRIKKLTFERPSFNDYSNYKQSEPALTGLIHSDARIDWINAKKFLANHREKLRKLAKFQYELYYKDITKPEYKGPQAFASLKLPDDMVSYSNIIKSIGSLLHEVENLETNKNSQKLYKPTIEISAEALKTIREQTSNNDRIERTAELHDIDIEDIKQILRKNEINTTLHQMNMLKSSDFQIMHTLMEKKYFPYDDSSLLWPTKYKKELKRYSSSELDQNDPLQLSIPLFTDF